MPITNELTIKREHDANHGYTLVEVMIAAVLSSILLLMVSGVWLGLGRSLVDNVAEGKVAVAANMAIESLRRDLSGHLPGAALGHKQEGAFVGRTIVDDDQLMLCFDGSPTNGTADWGDPDRVVVYRLDSDRLVRADSTSGTEFIAAGGVESFVVTELGSGLRIELTLAGPHASRTYTVETRDP